MIRVLVVDDDPIVSASLKSIIEADDRFVVCAIEGSGEAMLRRFPALKPDIVLMDIRMKGMGGIAAGKRLLETHPDAALLFLTTFPDDEYIIEALRMGARGFLLKQDYASLAPAMLAALSGQRVFGDSIASKLPRLIKDPERGSLAKRILADRGLGERESRIVELVAQGMSNREIGETLSLSEGTVRNYVSAALDKLGLRDRTQLAVFYYREIGGGA